MTKEKLERAFSLFDEYNSNDPNHEEWGGKVYPKELLYALRMSERLNKFAPQAPEYVHLAIRCQHVGRWEIARNTYPMDRKGYLQWRNILKQHHAGLAEKMLQECGYDQHTIERVKFLLLKKELYTNPDTQLLEDIVCLVFVEYYLEDFASKHPEEKVIDILKKTLKKMSPRAIKEAGSLLHTAHAKELLKRAGGDSAEV